MPFNGSGVYSLPAGSTATAGTRFLASQHNIPLADIAAALSSTMLRSGAGAMTGPLTLSGSVSSALHAVPYQQLVDERANAAITGGSVSGVTLSALAALFTAGVSKSAVLSPAQITADQNNYAPTQATAPTTLDAAATLRLSADAARTITGLVAPTTNASGREVRLINIGSYALTLAAENASSTAANRFALAAALVIPPYGAVDLIYDATSSRWRALAAAQVTNGNLPGSPTTTTQVPGDSSTNIATTEFVAGEISTASDLIDSWWTLISEQNPASVASVSWTGLSDYSELRLDVHEVYTNNGGAVAMLVQLSTDNGATWLSTGYISRYGEAGSTGTTGSITTALTGGAPIVFNGTPAGSRLHGTLYLHRLNATARRTTLDGVMSAADGATIYNSRHDTAAAHNALRVLMASGTILGNLTLWGRK